MNTSIERLEEIELERLQTFGNPDYQNWVRELNVSRLHVDRAGILKANEIMALWGQSENNRSIFANIKMNIYDK
tara:strand:- start:83 stop:304 length:222 start_codon:yes stop_codon:yes gene_type:complete